MKTMSRASFIMTANIVWLAQFVAEFLVVLAPDYAGWWRRQTPDLQLGCFEDTFRYDPVDRLFVLGLIWLLSMPLMNLCAWRFPDHWPVRLSCLWWNKVESTRSLVTAMVALVLLLWPVSSMLNTPAASTLILEGARTILLLGVLLYYRAIILSA
jgi:hypothetical protein